MTKQQWRTLMFLIFTMFFNVLKPVEAMFRYEFTHPLFVGYILLSVSFLKITMLFEHFVLFSIIILIVRVVKCLNHMVNAAEESLRNQIFDNECEIVTKQIQEWASLYTDLTNCCKHVTQSFNCLLSFSIMLSISHFVLLTYEIIYTIYRKGIIITDDLLQISFVILADTAVMTMPMIAGQLLLNQGVKLHRLLARLYNVLIIRPEDSEAKLIKDFLRLLKKKPLEVRFGSNYQAGMSLLPVMLMMSVNYLVILLQFNHVV
ncbi:hypothetical protein B5X24_HaOG200750 [Helicoverpa armigera]|nr:hypothetical protein B5X24_HaOG200750 [Helicoverpa armigera]